MKKINRHNPKYSLVFLFSHKILLVLFKNKDVCQEEWKIIPMRIINQIEMSKTLTK